MAVELVAGALLSSSLQFLFDGIGSVEVLAYLRRKSKKGSDLEEMVGNLKKVLTSVQAVIEDAEKKKRKSKSVEMWLDTLQDAVFDAEDLLDAIKYDVLQQKEITESSTETSKKRNVWKKKLQNVFSRPHNSEEGDIETKVKKLLESFKEIAGQKDLLGLEMMGFVQEKLSWRIPSTSLVDESQVYGRDFDNVKMVKWLLSDDANKEKICVISIVGMGGLGKTTLAQSVFNDKNVKEHFGLMAWVCVSEEFDICRVTKAILEEVTSHACDVTGLNSLHVRLKESLAGKKFLIVLDDVWCEKSAELDALCLPFKGGAQGSKIIVTTRSETVASNMRAVQIHRLQTLSEEACWKLFAKEVSCLNGDFTTNQELERIGREIVKKCKGLPLALKTLGGLLRSTRDAKEWKRILECDIWDLREDESDILPALKLSYHYLPSQLKRCFAYCSIFPTDYEFRKEELILLWMAENLLESPKRNRRIEEVGEEYFNGLVLRSLFQRSSTQESMFVMHDLVHDLAKSVSGENCVLYLEDGSPNEINVKKARHIAYTAAYINPYKRFNNVLQATKLRTFLTLRNDQSCRMSVRAVNDLLLKMRCLRILSLYGCVNISHLPYSTGKLIHLRYLDLSHTEISILPESLCKLFNLQTLKLYNCWALKNLPKDLHHLSRLRYLDLRFCYRLVEMPTQLSKLKNLQMLSNFIVGVERGTKIEELKELSHLREQLSIQKLENVGNVKDTSDQAKMMDKEHLEILKLYWSDGSNDDSENAKDVLGMLLPNRTLKELHVVEYPGKDFPNWLGSKSLSNLVSLKLVSCNKCMSLPPLGQLPLLKSLVILGFDALVDVGPEFYGDDSVEKPFPSLEILKFSNLSTWETWFQDDSGAFAKLIQLEIGDCGKITGVLPYFLPSLTTLKIYGCEELSSTLPRMPRVLEVNVSGCSKIMLQDESFCAALRQAKSCVRIRLSKCSSPMSIPIGGLPGSLKKLVILESGKLEIEFDCPHKSLEVITIRRTCDAVNSFPIDSFPNLRDLHITELENIESFSVSVGLQMMSLSSLFIKGCPSLVAFPEGGLPAPNLTKLVIQNCEKLKSLPKKMHNLLASLKHLEIYGCPEIDSFPEGGLPFSLAELQIWYCDKLTASRNNWGLKSLPNLRSFNIKGRNEDVESFLEEGLLPMSITHLDITGFPCLKSLDKHELRHLISLEEVVIASLPELQTFPGEVFSTSLKSLSIYDCGELQTISAQGLPASLEYLEISDCPKCQIMPEKGLPTSLKELSIYGFPELQNIPEEWLPNSLLEFRIADCPKLQNMPKQGLPDSLQRLWINNCMKLQTLDFPRSLQELNIRECPFLAEKCKREYCNITSHVPFIYIDDEKFLS